MSYMVIKHNRQLFEDMKDDGRESKSHWQVTLLSVTTRVFSHVFRQFYS